MVIGYLAARGFEADLEQELAATVTARHGRLFLCEKAASVRPAWAQNTWYDVRLLEIASISDAAKKLRSLGKWWTLESTTLHRRAQLIQDQLAKFKVEPLDFLGPLPEKELSAWMLIDNDQLLAAPKTEATVPHGDYNFAELKEAPSRAYLKLWELFTVHGVRPKPNEKCLELGASPGGWTWVLAKLGCEVTAVDRSPLAANVAAFNNVKFRSGNAFAVRPAEVGPIDWFFSDLICYPQQLEALVATWRSSNQVRNFVCTIKFKGPTDHATAQRMAAIPGANLFHLTHNKHELTWWLTPDVR